MDTPIPPTQKAKLVSLGPDKTEIKVHFNPASLVYTLENSTNQSAGKPKRQQFAAQFSGKLAMDLQFDTTDYGSDVRLTTNQIAMFMQATANASKDKKGAPVQAPPVLSFQWGSYEFKGTMESFKETIDFFSAEGIPLRALVSITLARLDKVLDDATTSATNVSGSLVPTGNGQSATDVATRGGDPCAARQLGTDNGLASLRFTGGVSLQVTAGIQLNPPAAFATPASTNAPANGATAGVSFGAGAGVVPSATLQMSAGVGGGSLFGGQASAGVPASAGAFAGLETGRASMSSTAQLDLLRIVRATSGANVSTDANSSFGPGGTANSTSGFSTSVGANFNFNDQLMFDND